MRQSTDTLGVAWPAPERPDHSPDREKAFRTLSEGDELRGLLAAASAEVVSGFWGLAPCLSRLHDVLSYLRDAEGSAFTFKPPCFETLPEDLRSEIMACPPPYEDRLTLKLNRFSFDRAIRFETSLGDIYLGVATCAEEGKKDAVSRVGFIKFRGAQKRMPVFADIWYQRPDGPFNPKPTTDAFISFLFRGVVSQKQVPPIYLSGKLMYEPEPDQVAGQAKQHTEPRVPAPT